MLRTGVAEKALKGQDGEVDYAEWLASKNSFSNPATAFLTRRLLERKTAGLRALNSTRDGAEGFTVIAPQMPADIPEEIDFDKVKEARRRVEQERLQAKKKKDAHAYQRTLKQLERVKINQARRQG